MFKRGDDVVIKEQISKEGVIGTIVDEMFREALALREKDISLIFENYASDVPEFARCSYVKSGIERFGWFHKSWIEPFDNEIQKLKSESTAL